MRLFIRRENKNKKMNTKIQDSNTERKKLWGGEVLGKMQIC